MPDDARADDAKPQDSGTPLTPMSPAERKRQRRKDLLTLDIPLVFGLALCTTLTIVEGMRALQGNGRSIAYTFEWPIIAAFIIWIYVRYKRESRRRMDGTPAPARPRRERPEATPVEQRTGAAYDFLDRYRRNVEEAEAEYDRQHGITPNDPQLRAWQDYVSDLHRKDPPGTAPDGS